MPWTSRKYTRTTTEVYPDYDCRAEAIIPDHNGDAWSSVLRLKCVRPELVGRRGKVVPADVRYHYENVYSLRRAVTKQCVEPMPPMNDTPTPFTYRVPTGAQDQFDDSDAYLDPTYRETCPECTRPTLIVDGGAK
jgi:hypothetical protein